MVLQMSVPGVMTMHMPSKNLGDIERVLSIVAGSILAVAALRGQRRRPMSALSGAAMVVRGLSGYCPASAVLGRGSRRDDTREALGGSRGVHIDESIVIARPARQLYAFWRDLRNLPQVFTHLECVDVVDSRTSRWRMVGPAGMEFAWDARIINDVDSELIAWQSLPGADIASAGSVTFHERVRASGVATEVRVHMQYDAPGGKAASWLARLTGDSPEHMVQAQLERLKETMERGVGQMPDMRDVPHGASAR